MGKMKIKRPIWYLIVPFLIHGLIAYLVQMCFGAAFLGRMNIPDTLTYGSDEMIELVQKLTEKIIAYNTQITSVTALLMIPFVVLLFRRDWKKREGFGIAKSKSVGIVRYTLLIPLGIVACVVSNNIINMSELVMYSDAYQQTSEAFYTASLPMMLIGIGILVPIAEEFMFRGLLYNRLKDLTTAKKAGIFCALFFGLYHGNLVQGIYGFLAGILLVLIYEKYGSMAAPVLMHMILNFTSVIVTKLGLFSWMFEDMMRVCIITVVCGLLLGFCLMFLVEMKCENSVEEVRDSE